MDGVTRQTHQHVEYDPEWEGAFNLQLKLSDILTIVQDWCATDVSAVTCLFSTAYLFVADFFALRMTFNYHQLVTTNTAKDFVIN